ncbi:MAG: polysaccharide export protein [Elusimicrobia bacterium]|nr:polysaccharide export protein [Elusimicrobiota bacterium]
MRVPRAFAVLLFSLALSACAGVSVTIPRSDARGGPSFQGGKGPAGMPPAPVSSSAPDSAPAAAETLSKPAQAAKADGTATKEELAIQAALAKVRSGKAGYKVRPGDLIEISVFQEKDLDRKLRVGPDGLITYPLAGKVTVGGLDVPAAEAELATALQKYLINPQVSIFVSEYSSSLVHILGEVRSPGSYPIPGDRPMTVLEAISQAGGFTQYASQERTRVIREADGKPQTFNVNVRAITAGSKELDMKLEPNDVIFVPESFF